MQLLKLNLLNSGTQLLLNRGNIQSVRELTTGTFIRHSHEKLALVVSQPIADITTPAEYVSGVIIPLVVRNGVGALEAVSINVDTISKVVEGFEPGTSFIFLNNKTTRYLAMSSVDEIETLANAIIGETGGGGVPGDTSGLLSAYLVNVNVIAGNNTITHNMNASVMTVYVKFTDTWMPWAWDDIAGNNTQIHLRFDEPAVVQVRLLLTTR